MLFHSNTALFVQLQHFNDPTSLYTGQGLLIANGAKWYRNRRLLTPAFHFEILKPYVEVYNECTGILLVRCTDQSV